MFNSSDWAGRTFKCTLTGVLFTIPHDVRPRAFYSFGKSFVDVGDGYYSRRSSSVEELKEKLNV